jgi:hypothetical protein
MLHNGSLPSCDDATVATPDLGWQAFSMTGIITCRNGRGGETGRELRQYGTPVSVGSIGETWHEFGSFGYDDVPIVAELLCGAEACPVP